jgi:hypothetical protein
VLSAEPPGGPPTGYHAFKGRYPDMTDEELFSELIRHRYKLFPDERIRNQLLSEVHHFSTLRHLVVAILSEEAGFLDNPLENQILFQNIISEELLKKKVPSTLT